MVNSVLVILFVMLLRLCARVCLLAWKLAKAALWLVTVPVFDVAVLSIAGLMWLCGGLAGAELPRLQMGKYGLMYFQWEDLYIRQYRRSYR